MSPETNEVIINNKTGEITDKPLIMGDASKPLTEEELNGIDEDRTRNFLRDREVL